MFKSFAVASRHGYSWWHTCRGSCLYSLRPCNVFTIDTTNNICYLGNTDAENELNLNPAVLPDADMHISRGTYYHIPD